MTALRNVSINSLSAGFLASCISSGIQNIFVAAMIIKCVKPCKDTYRNLSETQDLKEQIYQTLVSISRYAVPSKKLIAGSLACLAIAYPFKVVARQSVLRSLQGGASLTLISGFREIFENDGVVGLYKGFEFHVLSDIIKIVSLIYFLRGCVDAIRLGAAIISASRQNFSLPRPQQTYVKNVLLAFITDFGLASTALIASYPLWVRSVCTSVDVPILPWRAGMLFPTFSSVRF
eukprot:TRINITY_DN8333_c0_g1_i1.p1 TRINITY_DN8333_c0_g1~~TRINITY_DN8333_c0_g1_i1.p1  ORF type:complete len:273 (+),score=11.78 TRINITY_DN8333_c0_g1_i1:122-820(+)